MAAVHCVIIGFGALDVRRKVVFEYDDIQGEPHAVSAANINPYRVDAPDVILARRSRPICDVPQIGIGNKPIDGGNYLFTADENAAFLRREPKAERWFRRWLGADEFLNGTIRWYLWLGECPPAELRHVPEVMKRVDAVAQFRRASRSIPTRKLADTPTRFHVENIPAASFVIIPRHFSESRRFVPIGYFETSYLAGDANLVMVDVKLVHLGILSSSMHNAWVRYTCGRIKSDFRYSAGIVYNNFPWPENPTDAQRAAIEAAAQGVLDARAAHPNASLADLYDPLTMPPNLVNAHQNLDAAVDAAYGRKSFKNDAERVAFLFELYQRYTSLLPSSVSTTKSRKRVGQTAD